MRWSLAVLGLAALAACAKPAPPPPPPPGPPPIDEAAAKQGAEALWASTIAADTAGNADALLANFTDKVRVDVQGFHPLIGRAAVDSVIRPMLATRKVVSYEYSPNTTIVVSNDQVLQGGTFVETYVMKKKTSVEYGRYASSIVKDADGQWRFAYYMGFADSTVARR
jgi:uncharacterized protein (TIGR02246 family)